MGRVVFSFINLINELIHHSVTASSSHSSTLLYSLDHTKPHTPCIVIMASNETVILVTGELYSLT